MKGRPTKYKELDSSDLVTKSEHASAMTESTQGSGP